MILKSGSGIHLLIVIVTIHFIGKISAFTTLNAYRKSHKNVVTLRKDTISTYRPRNSSYTFHHHHHHIHRLNNSRVNKIGILKYARKSGFESSSCTYPFELYNTKQNDGVLENDDYQESLFKTSFQKINKILNNMKRIIRPKVISIGSRVNNLHPFLQIVVLLSFYILHIKVFTQHSIIFPFQLIPSDYGRFQSIGLDSLAGIISFIVYYFTQPKNHLFNLHQTPWTLPSSSSNILENRTNNQHTTTTTSPYLNTNPTILQTSKITSAVALSLLIIAYFATGRISSMIELYLYALAGLGFPLTIAMHRSLVVLLGHLVWVAIGSFILGFLLRPHPFFGASRVRNDDYLYENSFNHDKNTDNDRLEATITDDNGYNKRKNNISDENNLSAFDKSSSYPPTQFKWYTKRWNANWVWWTIGGYFFSSWMFNIADFCNQIILPPSIFEMAGEGVVSQLINPENNDLLASLVGYIAPCISAPWWEEVLYRGFLVPMLVLQLRPSDDNFLRMRDKKSSEYIQSAKLKANNRAFRWATFISGVIFSIHHVSITGAIPLAFLGWTWACIYAKSGNLLVTILIHAMWNSRVFLGSWLGL